MKGVMWVVVFVGLFAALYAFSIWLANHPEVDTIDNLFDRSRDASPQSRSPRGLFGPPSTRGASRRARA
jgi:hypothetical protein